MLAAKLNYMFFRDFDIGSSHADSTFRQILRTPLQITLSSGSSFVKKFNALRQ
jgi:hypothetical protein